MTKKWFIFITVFLASSMIYLDSAMLPVSLPVIQKNLSLTSTQLTWILNSYKLAIASLILIGGKLADAYDLKKIFTLGITGFGLFSLLCGFANSFFSLVLCRVLQGVSAACVIPTMAPLLFHVFHHSKRGFAVGLKVSLSSIMMALGPVIAGYLTQYFTWRWIFWINPFISLIGLILLLIVNPKIETKKSTFDFIGYACFALALLSLTFSLMQGKSWGWGSLTIILLFLASFIFGYFLFYWEKRRKKSEVFFSFFYDRTFGLCVLNILIIEFILSTTIFWPIFLQQVLDYTPSVTGWIMMFSFAPMLLAGPFAGKMVDRYGPKKPLILGYIFSFLSFLLLAFFLPRGGIGLILSFLLMGFFTTCANTPSYIGALNVFAPHKRSNASAILNGSRALGRSLGIAFMGALLITTQMDTFSQYLKSNPKTEALDPKAFDGLLSKVPKAVQYAKSLGLEEKMTSLAKHSSSIGIITITLTGAFLCLGIGIILYFFMGNKKRIYEENNEMFGE